MVLSFIKKKIKHIVGLSHNEEKHESTPIQEKKSHKPQFEPGKKQHSRRRKKPKGTHEKHNSPEKPKAPPKMPEIVEFPKEEGKTRLTDLALAKEVLAGCQDQQFKYCTPIQEKCLPFVLNGKDVTGKAQTGTGKTAAFLTAIFTLMLKNPGPKRGKGTCRGLVLAPTRELAIQIHKDAEEIGKYCGLTNMVVFGGMPMKQQRDKLQRPIDLLIGTPGRILDFIRQRELHFDKAEFLVIDEADRMLDMGFIVDVKRIVSRLPDKGKRQTFFFSATLTGDILRLIDRWLHEPEQIEIEPEQVVADLIEQKFYSVPRDDKFALLNWFLKNDNVNRALVFVNRKDFTERLTKDLRRRNIKCDFISGDVPQHKRMRLLEDFRSMKTPILIATDVAARGIHVDGITHVFNYDLPVKAEEYVHRIGRTGRAGLKGKAISFVCEYGAYTMPEIEEFLGETPTCEQPAEEMLKKS